MYSTLSIFGILLLLLPTVSARDEQVIPAYMMKYFPLLNVTDAPCEPTKWLETYENASYVGWVNVRSSYLMDGGYWYNIYEEEHRFKGGSKPEHLITPYRSLMGCERYIIASNADGHISSCTGFAINDGGVATRALRFCDSEVALLGKLRLNSLHQLIYYHGYFIA